MVAGRDGMAPRVGTADAGGEVHRVGGVEDADRRRPEGEDAEVVIPCLPIRTTYII